MNQNQQHMQIVQPQAAHCVTFRDVDWMRIAMLEPCMQPNGRGATRVYYQDGSYDYVAHSCEFMLKRMAYHHRTDLQYAKELIRECYPDERQRKCAYWFTDDCCVVPVKCKSPTAAGTGPDSALGYIVLQHLWHYKRLENNNTLVLFGPEHKGVEILQRIDSMKSQLTRAINLRACYELRQLRERLAAEKLKSTKKHIGRYWT